MENYYSGDGPLPPGAEAYLDAWTGLPLGQVQDYHGPLEFHDGMAYRFHPAYDPRLRALTENYYYESPTYEPAPPHQPATVNHAWLLLLLS